MWGSRSASWPARLLGPLFLAPLARVWFAETVAPPAKVCEPVKVGAPLVVTVMVAALAGAAAVAVTAEAIAASATESTNLTDWLVSLTNPRLTGSIAWRLIAASVTRASWPQFTVLARDA
mgnify:CR=1 FL=1